MYFDSDPCDPYSNTLSIGICLFHLLHTVSLLCQEDLDYLFPITLAIDKKIEQATKQRNQTKQFKKALLQQMFV